MASLDNGLASATPGGSAGQWRLILLILLPVLLLLGLAYVFLLRQPMVPLARDLRAEDAAEIVEALKKDNVSYALREGGTSIDVPADQADALRLQIASSDVARKGGVGFELFNESDMGLTDFAQKVNYQRALQGEIARTIMGMDGIASARVHLALPERQLFRAERETAKAAVMVTPRPGVVIDAGRVAGIQELVAAAVPSLPIDQVSVLDGEGQLIGPTLASQGVTSSSTGSALERSYADRGATALRTLLSARPFELKVKVIPRLGGADTSGQRDHSILAVLFTPTPLSMAEQQASARAVRAALGLDRSLGDDMLFSMAPQSAPLPSQQLTAAPVPGTASAQDADPLPWWTWPLALGMGLLSALMLGWFARARRRQRLVRLADRVRHELLLESVPA